MNLLFVHQNFPGQFKHLAPALAQGGEHQVVAMHINPANPMPGVRMARYSLSRGTTQGVHRLAAEFETKAIRGEAAFEAARALRSQGFTPDTIIAHPGWGESLFLKEVWPKARLGIYCEFYYGDAGDADFDPEFADSSEEDRCRVRLKNANYLLNLEVADAGLAPTRWQRSLFPAWAQPRISVIHDGVDTDRVAPRADVRFTLQSSTGSQVLTRDDEVITFVNRNLEPYRGYHVFMRALPRILRERPNAKVLIVGGNGVSYGRPPGDGRSWKQVFLDEVGADLDLSRVFFLGLVPYEAFVALIQLSRVHVYLTYPFVLGWSLLEAMSAGCAIVASDTAPVREMIHSPDLGRLVPFHAPDRVADEVLSLLADAPARAALGQAARQAIVEGYDLKRQCLPRQLDWVRELSPL